MDVFPKLQSCTRLGTNYRIFDVKFYPYALPDDDHVFAAVAETDAFVCRPKKGADPPYDILRFFRDDQKYDDEAASYNSLVWAKDPTTGDPLLCLAGSRPKQIKIIDIASGKVVRVLSGHGRGINDLAVSPIAPHILASCAEDGTIRLWDLRPEYEAQPCVALLGGEGHKQPILAIHFHPNGSWLLSGGIDTAVALWAVPSPASLERRQRDKRQTEDVDSNDNNHKIDDPQIIYYPYFFSEEVHANYVDSLAFYGDLIISRAAKNPDDRSKTNEILVWKIIGFDSGNAPPDEPAVPAVGQRTRSAFSHEPGRHGFQRIVTLFMPHTDRFYHRFGLYHRPDRRPLLVMANQHSRYSFFDLQKLDEGTLAGDKARTRKRGRRGRRGAANVVPVDSLSRLAIDAARQSEERRGATPDSRSTPTTPALDAEEKQTSATPAPQRTFALSDPFAPLLPDHTVTANTKLSKKQHFATSQIAWSPDGTWMVGVGDYGMMCMFYRSPEAVER